MGLAVNRHLKTASDQVIHAGELLLSPSPANLDQCAVILQSAIKEMEAFRPDADGSGVDGQELEQAQRLKTALTDTRRLLDHAARFHQNWLRRRGVISGGYTQDGNPAAVDGIRRLIVKG